MPHRIVFGALALFCLVAAGSVRAEGRLILYTVSTDAPAEPPPLLARFQDEGWAIRINRVPMDFHCEHDFGKALFTQARGEGYSKVVLAGRSSAPGSR